jgi:hypothetical protein
MYIYIYISTMLWEFSILTIGHFPSKTLICPSILIRPFTGHYARTFGSINSNTQCPLILAKPTREDDFRVTYQCRVVTNFNGGGRGMGERRQSVYCILVVCITVTELSVVLRWYCVDLYAYSCGCCNTK